MQIYEVKNGTAEILYASVDSNVFLSDFLCIEDDKYTTISQVTDITTTENPNVNKATVRFLLSVDKTDRLTKYNGHMPPKNAAVDILKPEEILNTFAPKYNGIIWGNYARQEDLQVATDLTFLSSGSAIICDKTEQCAVIVKKIVQSLKKNNSRFLLLDFEGKYKSVKAQNNAVYGQNYRIPLDSIALDFIFENDLNDCPIETKAIIQGIILELQKYAESAGFIPFEMFINIIMQECKRSNSAGLMIFANKLLKYKQKKIFADNKKQFEIINNCSSSLKIDMSEVDDSFYPLIFSSIISNTDKKFYVLSDINEENSTSSVLKNIYEKQNVRLIPVIKHDCKFLGKIKSNTSNMAVFAPVSKQKTEEPYGLFLDSISNDEFILWGENTLFIPIIVSLSEMLNNFKEGLLGYSTADDVTEEDLNDLDRINLQAIREAIRAENVTEEDLDSLNELRERPQIIEEEETTENNYRINEEENQEQYNSAPDESVRQQYQQTQPQQNYQQPVQQNNNTVQNSEPVRTAPQKPMPNPDTIPVYEPKEPERQTNITFFEGDRVSHAQYGNGVVEKVMKYGQKTLCSIMFEQVGRRLLDPNVTIIEKL